MAIPVKSRLWTSAIRQKNPMMVAANKAPYFRALPLRGCASDDLPLPSHSRHTPVPEQWVHLGVAEFKWGFLAVPLHSSHFPEPSQN